MPGQGRVWRTDDNVSENNPEAGWEAVCYITRGRVGGECFDGRLVCQ